jgi:hypothetical protein
MAPNVLRLGQIVEPPGPVELPGGRIVPCKGFTFRMFELERQMGELPEGVEQDEKLRELVAMCVPEAGDDVKDLTAEQMVAIVGHSKGRLEQVLEWLESRNPRGNAQAPAARSRRRRSG